MNQTQPQHPLKARLEARSILARATEEVLSPEARQFITMLERTFRSERSELLNRRAEQAEWLKSGGRLEFPAETNNVRSAQWTVAPCPPDLKRRHVEITGPAEAKMMINALNSGADVFMADIEDSLSPTWENVIFAQQSLYAASRGTLELKTAEKTYKQNSRGATLIVRPRGWHLSEANFLVDGRACSGSLFDFGLHLFHNARALLDRGSGPYFYLPKLESSTEARLWNKVFVYAQEALGLPRGTIRATVLIETITAAFEMDEILFELREHASGLNAGRWDYLFSILKKFSRSATPFPDRARITMDLPFLRSYCELMVQTCHRRGAHAIGGMSAFIPSRKDKAVNEIAFKKVTADKEREIALGFDGSWVAHPDLVPLVKKLFVDKLEGAPDQKHMIGNIQVLPADLLPRDLPTEITEQGIRTNISVALQYIHRWLQGQGAVAIHNLMEDAATAEISRAQLWQWLQHNVVFHTGKGAYTFFSESFYRDFLKDELSALQNSGEIGEIDAKRVRKLMDYLVLHHEFVEFLTKPAYDMIQTETQTNGH
ncbi:MAG TPA: malate synthase A [Bdellovibrionota bacterium]